MAAENKFSELAWNQIKPIYQKIDDHPFNRKLAQGTLAKDKYQFYKDQDAYYLKKFSKALSMLATKLDEIPDIKMVLNLASNSFDEDLSLTEISLKGVTPSNFTYTHFLLSTASLGTKEELAAAILPCYWIYLKVADDLKKIAKNDAPYISWIEFYSSKGYRKDVLKMIDLTNKLAKESTPEIREKMLLAFKVASKLELNFWEDSYEKKEILK